MRKVIPLLILLAGLALVFGFGLDRYFSIEVLRENHADLQAFVDRHPVYAPILFCLVYATSTALSVPGGALLTVVGGFLFGTVFGTIFSVTGATIGATLLFFAARTAFADLLRARAGSGIERMRARFRENALSYMLFLRLIPAFPFSSSIWPPHSLGYLCQFMFLARLSGSSRVHWCTLWSAAVLASSSSATRRCPFPRCSPPRSCWA